VRFKAAALRDYDRLIQQRPSVSSLEERAALRSEAENRDGAMEDLAWALKLSNGETRAMVFALRAKVNERFGDHDAALKDYKDAIDVDPSDPDPWLWRARAYAAIPDVDRAVADYEVVIQKAPEFAEAYFEESGLYFDAGKFDNALDKLNQIKVQDQNQPYFYFRRGRVLYAMQDFAGAFPDFSKVSELGWGDNAANNLLLAKTYRYLGRYRDAVGNYLKAVRNSPDWPYAPISLYLARVQEGEKAPDVELASLAEKFDKAEWPYPIVELLLGQRSGDSVFALADNDEKRCEANFYVGERELLSAHNEKAVNYLSEAAKKCPRQFLEYADALFELKRLRP
jgi:tetratricopeptide (TPR) repeat protein